MAVLESVLVPPIKMDFLANSSDTDISLRFLVELFLSNFLIRSGDIELNPGPERYRGVLSEAVLFYVAKIITQRGKIQSVGKRLGMLPDEIDMYVASSDTEGAYHMLKYWTEKFTAQQQQLMPIFEQPPRPLYQLPTVTRLRLTNKRRAN